MKNNDLNYQGKRILKAALWMLLVLPLCLTACSKDDTDGELELCQAALDCAFPDAQNLWWEVYDEFNVANFTRAVDGLRMEVWYRSGGIPIMQVTDYKEDLSRVPSSVSQNLKYPYTKILTAALCERFNDNSHTVRWLVTVTDGTTKQKCLVSERSSTWCNDRVTPWHRGWSLGIQNVHPH